MVLAELGGQINAAFAQLSKSSTVDEEVINKLVTEISKALLMADVNVNIVSDFRNQVKLKASLDESQASGKKKAVQNVIFAELLKMLSPGKKPYQPERGKTNIVMTVGLQGAGKTTTCTKYAVYYQRKGWKVGLVCADTFRAGAYDQLKQNASKTNVRFYGSLTETDPAIIAKEGIKKFEDEGCDIIIVDTSGRHKQESSLFDEMEQIAEAANPDEIIFVMDSTIGQAAHDQAMAFKTKVKVGSVIITKLDGHAKGGGALSAVAATGSPIVFIGVGEQFEDLKYFEPKSFLSQMLGMGDINGLMERIKDSGIDAKSDLYNRFAEGQFTLRDMYEHLQNIMSLGPMGQILDMLPGMKGVLGKGAEQEQTNKLKSFLCLMDSMSNDELDHNHVRKIMTPERINRISKGAGKPVQDVQDLLKTYQKFEELIKKKGNGKMNLAQLMKDPTALLKGGAGGQNAMGNLAKAVNPQMLKQMGGAAGLSNMMKSLGGMGGMGGMGGGGMPDMSTIANMAKQLGGKGGKANLAKMMGGLGGRGMR